MTEQAYFPKGTPRLRRLRTSEPLRAMLRETELNPNDFIYPLFVRHGNALRHEIRSMPGLYQLSVDEAVIEVESAVVNPLSGLLALAKS